MAKLVVPKVGAVGYIVGYDGQKPDGAKPAGKYVLPDGGMNANPTFHSNKESAIAELGERTTYVERGLLGANTYILKVHKVKARWFPFVDSYRLYRSVK